MRQYTNCIMKVPLFKNLDETEIDEVMSVVKHTEYQKGDLLYAQTDKIDSLFVIHKGKIKITRYSEDGKEKVIRILSSGDFLGELALFSEQTANTYAEMLEYSEICSIQSVKMKDVLVNKPNIMFKMLDEISLRLKKTEAMLEYTTTNSALVKVARLLYELETNQIIKLPTTKTNLASQIGVTSETFSRKLKELTDQKLIRIIDNKTIKITNMREIEDLIL